jgi:hypothetical protein
MQEVIMALEGKNNKRKGLYFYIFSWLLRGLMKNYHPFSGLFQKLHNILLLTPYRLPDHFQRKKFKVNILEAISIIEVFWSINVYSIFSYTHPTQTTPKWIFKLVLRQRCMLFQFAPLSSKENSNNLAPTASPARFVLIATSNANIRCSPFFASSDRCQRNS